MRKANKILAIALAVAIMLGVMPMTAFAGDVGADVAQATYGGTAPFERESVPHGEKENNDGIIETVKPVNTDDNALASEGQCGSDVYWTFDEATGALTISGEGSIWESSFINEESIKSVTIESGVTEIGYCAFSGCTNLKSVTIPDSVLYIGSYAFYDCDITGELVIPSGVIWVGYQAFEKNRNLETLTISEGVVDIGENAFAICESLKTVNIPVSISELDYGAFYGCSSITDVYYAGTEARWNNLGATEYFGLDMTKVNVHFANEQLSGRCGNKAYWMFDDKTGTLTISGEGDMWAYDIGDSRPFDSDSIKIIIEPGVTSIGNYAFAYCRRLTSITIPDSVTSIGYGTFEDCSSLTSIVIPDSVTNIGNYAFLNCSSLTSIAVDSENKNYSSDTNGVLYNKDKTELIQYPIGNERTSFTIPDSVTSIGEYAFDDCSSLTSVTIPGSVTIIDGSAFSECSSLTSVTIPDSVMNIGDLAFEGCSSLISITVDENNNNYCSDSFGVLYSKDKTHLIQYPVGNTRTSFAIPDSVKRIGIYSFAGCSSLTSIEIPDSVVIIDDVAFSGCSSITSVRIPNSVTSIGTYAFWDCSSLTSIVIPDSVTNIGPGDVVFDGSLVIWCYKGSYAHQYAIENGIPFEFIKTVRSVSIPDMTIRYRSSAYISPLFDADDGAEYTIVYSSSNPSVISVDGNGRVTSNKTFGFTPGSAVITVTVTDSNGNTVSDTCTVSVTFSPIQWIIKIVLFGWIWY